MPARDLAPTQLYRAATKSDSVNEADPSTGGLWVGTGGNLVAVRLDDVAVSFLSVPAGSYLAIVAKRINATGSTAADIVFFVTG